MTKLTYRTLARVFTPVVLAGLQACASTSTMKTTNSAENQERDIALQIARDQLSTDNPLLRANAVSIQRKISETVDKATEWTSGMIMKREATCAVVKLEKPAAEGEKSRWVARCVPQQTSAPAPEAPKGP